MSEINERRRLLKQFGLAAGGVALMAGASQASAQSMGGITIVGNYNELSNLSPSPELGHIIKVTDDGLAGDFIVKNDGDVEYNKGTLIAFNDSASKYAQRLDTSRVCADWFGTVGDGSTDDFEALNAAVQYVRTMNSKTSIISATLYLGQAKNYAIDGRLHFNDISVEGQGSVFTPLTVTSGLRISGTRMVHRNYKVIWFEQQNDPLAESIIFGDVKNAPADEINQTSKNIFEQLNSRNAYRGFVFKNDSNPGWGNIWNNCRSDNNWDWQWHMDFPQGTTTNTWINCHARGQTAVGAPKGFFASNSNDLVFSGGMAVDGAIDGSAFSLTNSLNVVIDSLTIESCKVTSDLGWLVQISANSVDIGTVQFKSTIIDVGEGNTAYLVQFTGGVVDGYIRQVSEIFPHVTSEHPVRTGRLFKVRNNNSTLLKLENINLDDVQTLGNEKNVINHGDTQGYVVNDAFLPAAGIPRREMVNQTPSPGEFDRFVDDGSQFHIKGVIFGGTKTTATTGEFANINDPINTLGKFIGKIVPNITTGLSMQARGGTPSADWQPSDGGVAVTPA